MEEKKTVEEQSLVFSPPSFFSSDSLAVDRIPDAIQKEFDRIPMVPKSKGTMIDEFVRIAKEKLPAKEDYKFWGGDPQPWRNGDDSVV